MKFEQLKDHPKYEILIEYPFTIRKGCKIIKPYQQPNKYYRICLNGKKYYLHRLIAKQFIPNPENKSQVDHINGDRTDNHLENLAWVTLKENATNIHKDSIKTFDTIEVKSELTKYNDYEFKDHYFDGVYFYRKDYRGKYVQLNYFGPSNSKKVKARDLTNHQRTITLSTYLSIESI
jgi:hypothetical protein